MNLVLPWSLRGRGLLKGKAHVVLVCIFLASLSQLLLLLKVSPTIVRGDGVGYYTYLRSLVFDHDVDFRNEYGYFASILPEGSQPLTTAFLYGPRTATGRLQNPWPVGPAILWSPFFLVGHVIAKLAGQLGLPVAADGYSLPYQLGVAVGSAVYAFAGLVLVYRLCRDHFSAFNCLLSLILVWFGTSLTAYMYFMPSMSHAVSFFCTSAFIYAWHRTRNGRSLVAWGGLGILGGLMTLQRFQDSLFMLIVGVEMCSIVIEQVREKRWGKILGLAGPALVLVAGVALMFLLQIIVWQILYGEIFPNVQQESMGFSFDWAHPRIAQVLFSSRHGLLSWTPLVVFGLAGLVLLYRKDKVLTLALTIAFLLQLYMVSCWPHWHQGASFGGRMFISCSAAFVLGLAAFVDWLSNHVSLRWLVLVGGLFVLWNYVLLYQYGTGMIPRHDAVYWSQVINNAVIMAKRFVDALGSLFS
jgi:hypothetical protein